MPEVERIIKHRRKFFEVLQLPETATKKEIREKYKRIAVRIHPDRNKHPKAEEAFTVLNKAYEEALKGRTEEIPQRERAFYRSYNPQEEFVREVFSMRFNGAHGMHTINIEDLLKAFHGRTSQRQRPAASPLSEDKVLFYVVIFVFIWLLLLR
ncbi:hypothetical protein NEFER03_1615 [Nematocida sp. LUAm3]|nr:hypothetical protein NEFER03_1615 [Nematocida sp. LUAm3]KAI5176125.1 hypothetical protein NEFER02_1946 [Nematocida sp. LUAm2]KAI5179013.1 hypothetical protein NEFER01_1889 [Nematocida sp. LUAm1]